MSVSECAYVRTYVRIRIWNFAWGFSKYTYVPYVRTYVYFLKPQAKFQILIRTYVRTYVTDERRFRPQEAVSENAVETCSPSKRFKNIRTYVPETDVRTNVCAYVRTLNEQGPASLRPSAHGSETVRTYVRK